ncbi:MAG: glycoside hydrolase family 9 protein [Calditrichaeota bacterium]|nr:glycoside hydrolase family 9 protein [Calditrichota bacterium]
MTLLWFFLLSLTFNTDASQSWIRVNQLGYTTNSVKVAVWAGKTNEQVETFEVVDVLTGKTVFNGSSQHIHSYGAWSAFKKIYRLDFSDYKKPGMYMLKTGETVSSKFTISDQVYNASADFLLKYMRQQRCGYNPFLKDSCHVQDGFIVDYPGDLDSTQIDVTGGWHDASDYLQYVTTSANATFQMLFAFQQNPQAFGDLYDKNGNPGSNGIPDILDEAKWGLDWLDKMNPEYGVMFNQIADDRDHRKFTLPTLDSVSYGRGLERPVYFITGQSQGLAKYKNRTTGVSSAAAKFASAFALGSEIIKKYYPDFSEKISQKSVDAFRFAKTDLGVTQTACNVSPYFYEEDNYVDDMELAAATLFNHLKDSSLLKDADYWGTLEPVTPWMIADTARHYQWYPFMNTGHYLLAKADKKIREKYCSFLKKGIDAVNERAQKNGFLMGIPFIWCSNNLVTAFLTQLRLYNELSSDNQYIELEAAMRDWLFGCNPWGTSMIVGYPEDADFPADPHTAFTAAFGYPIDGGLVDGPVYAAIFNRLRGLKIVHGDEYKDFQSDLVVYHDDYGDYSTNEPTMDGTACLTYYLSAMENHTVPEKYNKKFGAIIRGDTTKKEIHLIFSAHEFNDGGKVIRETLKKQGAQAHFFFTGDFYRNPENAALIQTLKNDKHFIGAHSDKHLLYAAWEKRDSLLVERDHFLDDLKNNYREMARFGISETDANLFLPPYEWYNQRIGNWTKNLGLTLISFTPGVISAADYTWPEMGTRYRSSQEIMDNILELEQKQGLNGCFLLIHLGSDPRRTDKFYNRLDELIRALKNRGYRFTLFKP